MKLFYIDFSENLVRMNTWAIINRVKYLLSFRFSWLRNDYRGLAFLFLSLSRYSFAFRIICDVLIPFTAPLTRLSSPSPCRVSLSLIQQLFLLRRWLKNTLEGMWSYTHRGVCNKWRTSQTGFQTYISNVSAIFTLNVRIEYLLCSSAVWLSQGCLSYLLM